MGKMNKKKVNQENIDRRTFLHYTGGFAVGATLLSGGSSFWGELFETEEDLVEPVGLGIEEFKVTLCGGCGGGCSVVVRLIDGRAVGVRGNPHYPLNRGHVCPKGLARLQHLYNPDRIKSPLRRLGHRGDDRWEEITWEDALRELSNRLAQLKSQGQAHQVALMAGEIDNIDRDLAERFMTAYGSPNFFSDRSGELVRDAMRQLYGDIFSLGYDLENCNYLLCFGDLLGNGPSPVWAQGAFSYLRQGRDGTRTKIVYVGSRMNLTAANADEWISIRPGSEGALALGIAHIIIQQDLYDHDFVDRHTHGFNTWRSGGKEYTGFKEFVLNNYPPRRVSEITGAHIHIINRLALEFARNRPALAIGYQKSAKTSNSLYNLMSIGVLNGVVGSIDRPGGAILQKSAPLGIWPSIQSAVSSKYPRLDESFSALPAQVGGNHQAFLEALANREPYPVKILIALGSNPIFDEWGGNGYNRSYDQVELIVSLSPFMDDTTRYADLVLPTNVDFESWGYGNTANGTSLYSHLSLKQPVVNRNRDTMQPGDIFLNLARQLKGDMADAMPWNNTRQALLSRLYGIADANEGKITTGSYERDWLQSLAKLGWRSPGFSDRKDFIKQLTEIGGWWDPLYNFGELKKRFPTPTGKFEFASLTLMESFRSAFGEDIDPLETAAHRLELDATSDELIQPHYEHPVFEGDPAQFPLILIPYRTVGIGDGEGANQPLMQEFIDPLYSTTWKNVVELHRDTARSIGVEDGEEVVVESPRGRIHCRVKISPVNRPDVACIAIGFGHNGYGRYADGIGANPKILLAKIFDRVGGEAATSATRVRIHKV